MGWQNDETKLFGVNRKLTPVSDEDNHSCGRVVLIVKILSKADF